MRRRQVGAAVISAVLAVGTLTGGGYAKGSHVILHATSKRGSWESRVFTWPSGPMLFRADMNCASLEGPPAGFFRAKLVSQAGRIYLNFNFVGNGTSGSMRDQGHRFPAGKYRLRVTTNCLWVPWHVTISTYRS
jgi:hypothetical protein